MAPDALESAAPPDALEPGFHRVRAHCDHTESGIPLRQNALDPGFMTFQLARRTRTAMLMVPV